MKDRTYEMDPISSSFVDLKSVTFQNDLKSIPVRQLTTEIIHLS